MNIEITNVCNLQCSFCPPVERSKQWMSVEAFRQVIEQVAPFTRLVTLHLMGEPLLHPDLEQLFEVCAEKQMQIFLVTNGLLLKHPERLLNPVIRQVSFSLHSFSDNFAEKDPTAYLDRIFDFTELAFEKRPKLLIHYRLWNIGSSLQKDKLNAFYLKAIEQRFQISLPHPWDPSQKKGVPIKNTLSLHYDTEFTWPSLDLPFLGDKGTCYGLRTHFGILADGTVVPCCLDKEGVIPLGNLFQTPLKDILNSPRAMDMANGFRNRKLSEDLCQRCPYIERFERKKNPRSPFQEKAGVRTD